jgi:hypothetical protein
MLVARLRASHGSWVANAKLRNEAAAAIIQLWQDNEKLRAELEALKLEK